MQQIEQARSLAYAALFCSLTGLYALAGMALLRSGLPAPTLVAPFCATLLVAVCFSPFLSSARRPTLLLALAALCIPVLGYLDSTLALVVAAAAAVAGLIRGSRWLHGISHAGIWFLLLAPPALALHFFPAEGMMFVFAPETAAYGLLDNASYFQTALAHVIQVHRVPSIGADGLQVAHYHYGSHFWFAGIALAVGGSPLYAYPFAQLSILVPLLYFSVCAAATELERPVSQGPALVMICVGVITVFDPLVSHIHYVSESFTFSLIGALLALPSVVRLHDDSLVAPGEGAWKWIVALAAIALISALKVSTGYVLAVMVVFAAWRRHGVRWQALAVLAVAGAILAGSQALFAPRGFYLSNWLTLLASYRQYVVPTILFTFALPVACALYAWCRPAIMPSTGGAGTGSRLEVNLPLPGPRGLASYLLSLPPERGQLLIVGSMAAYAPVLILPIGSNAIYFSLMPHWLLLPFAAVFLVRWDAIASARRQTWLGFGVVLVLFATTVPFLPIDLDLKGLRGFLTAVDDGAPGSRLMNEPQAMKKFFSANIVQEHVLFSAAFVKKLEQYPWKLTMADIVARARAQGRQFAVFVPPSNREFWNKLAGTGPYWCADMHLYIPSQTGALMIKGLQPLDQNCMMFAPGSPDYGSASHTAETPDAELCGHAAGIGVRTVLILNSATDPALNRTLACNA